MNPMPTRYALYGARFLLSLSALASGVATISGAAPVVETFARLQLPAPLMTWMGLVKIVGALALWVPRAPRLREWTYAGFTFAMSGATYVHLSGGDDLFETSGPILLLVFTLASYWLEHRERGQVSDAW